MSVLVHTVHFLDSNEELINRVLPLVPWAGGWNHKVELRPNTQTHHMHQCTHVTAGANIAEFVWPGKEGAQGGYSKSGPCPGPRGLRWWWESKDQFYPRDLGSAQTSIGCAYWLWSSWRKNGGRFSPDIWRGTERRCTPQTHLHFICWAQSLRANLSEHTWQTSELVHRTFNEAPALKAGL